MAREFAKSFYASRSWEQTRLAYLQSKHGLCEIEGCTEPGVIVHHKVHITPKNINDPNITLAWGNLQLLCMTHHNQIHHGNGEVITRDDVCFNAYGELIKR